jgi:hypothetical protein
MMEISMHEDDEHPKDGLPKADDAATRPVIEFKDYERDHLRSLTVLPSHHRQQ